MSDQTVPPGVIAIMTDPQGRVMAAVSDFEPDRPAGYTVREAQEARAKRQLASAVVRAYCSPVVADALSACVIEQIADCLHGRGGCKVTIKDVGGPPA